MQGEKREVSHINGEELEDSDYPIDVSDQTETIDFRTLLSTDVTSSGSFDIQDIWNTTFGKVMQALPIPALLIDNDLIIVAANQSCARISARYEQMEGAPFIQLFPNPNMKARIRSIVESVFVGRHAQVTEGRLAIEETEIWGRMTFRSIRIATGRLVLGLIEDLTTEKKHQQLADRYQKELEKQVEERTAELMASNQRLQRAVDERKKAEDLLLQTERLKAVGELASGAAHNFNNLLQIIMNASRLGLMCLDSGDFDKARRSLEQILESSEFGAETVRRLQSFSSVRSTGHPQGESIFDLDEVVRPAIEMTKPWWKTNPEKLGISIDFEASLGSDCFVKGKKHELFEVVVNLIKNAAEASPDGGKIKVRSYSQFDRVFLVVEDSGVGIPGDQLKSLFIPFYTTKLTAGAGLGLASSMAIVKRHGGTMRVSSSPGQGSRFTVILPKGERVDDETLQCGGPIPCGPLSILVIDDEEAVRNMLQEGLEEMEHTVYAAKSGEQGIEVFKSNSIQVVVTDLGMPGMTGWEVGARIRDICHSNGRCKTPVLLLTGWGDQVRELEKKRDSGVDLVLPKPIDFPKLLSAIREVLSRNELESRKQVV